MKKWQTGILLEGPTDRWRFGDMAGCIFGNTVTQTQRRKVASVFRKNGRSLVLLLDPEEYGKRGVEDALAYFETRLPGRVCAVKLPTGTDPGKLDRAFMHAYVKEQAAKKGVEVVYKKVA